MKRFTVILMFIALIASARAQKPSLNIVFDGDSQTAWGTYSEKILSLLGSAGYSNIRSINYGVSGQLTGDMVKDVSSQIVTRYNSGYAENIVLYWIGANDAPNGASTNVGRIKDNLAGYYNKLKIAGFKVLMINLPDSYNRTGTDLINAMFAREYSNLSHVLVNCREKGGVFEDYTNSTYFRDKVHLSTTGFKYLAEHYVYSRLISLIDQSAPTPSPSPSPTPPPPATDLSSGLSQYYKFDETSGKAIDQKNSNNGTVSSGVTRGSSGKINGAYFFDSNEDHVLLAKKITQKSGSYSFWFKINAFTDDLIILGNNAYQSRIFIGNKNNLKLETNKNGEEFAFYNNFSIGNWYFIALTRNNNTVKFYKNGKYIGSSTISGSTDLTVSQIGFNGRSFKGSIDELGIWSKTLTEADVSALYNNGKGLTYPFNAVKSAGYKNTSAGTISPDSIEVNTSESFFYPNPASDVLYISHAISPEARLIIYDLRGSVITEMKIENGTVNISDLKKGVYIIKLIDQERTFINKLIAK